MSPFPERWLLFAATSFAGATGGSAAAAAAEVVAYSPADGSRLFESIAGVLYVGLVVWFLSRTISRRVKKFTTEVIGGHASLSSAT